jgi:predicted LPLAT superfamily acyltransferase
MSRDTSRAAIQAAAAWTQTPERGNYFLMRVMAGLSLAMGRAASRPLLRLVAAYFVLFSFKGRAASRDYLNRA